MNGDKAINVNEINNIVNREEGISYKINLADEPDEQIIHR